MQAQGEFKIVLNCLIIKIDIKFDIKMVKSAKMHSKRSFLKYFIHFVLISNITIP